MTQVRANLKKFKFIIKNSVQDSNQKNSIKASCLRIFGRMIIFDGNYLYFFITGEIQINFCKLQTISRHAGI